MTPSNRSSERASCAREARDLWAGCVDHSPAPYAARFASRAALPRGVDKCEGCGAEEHRYRILLLAAFHRPAQDLSPTRTIKHSCAAGFRHGGTESVESRLARDRPALTCSLPHACRDASGSAPSQRSRLPSLCMRDGGRGFLRASTQAESRVTVNAITGPRRCRFQPSPRKQGEGARSCPKPRSSLGHRVRQQQVP
jgi:hypothetical protein